MILYFLLIPIIYIVIKLILYFIVQKYGKFTYKGFQAMGFAYDTEKDMFYSTKNAWQKKFGYCHLYDVLAPVFRMIIDTEPVKFFYNNKNWLITFWKGQYGIATGAEIGIYNTKDKRVNKKTIYFPASEEEMLNMSFKLYKKDENIMQINARHWWLAIFKLGMFSKPKDLIMDIKIVFPNKEMLEAFLHSFQKLRHNSKNFKVIDNTFYFAFQKPHSHKVWTRFFITDNITQLLNKKNVNLYNMYLANVIDVGNEKENDNQKLIFLNNMIPDIFKNPSDKKVSREEKNIVFLNTAVYSKKKDDLV